MLVLKRNGLLLAAGLTAFLTGCSDYPDSGVLDTRFLRTEVSIVEVEGNVYGLKSGAVEAYSAYLQDSQTLNRAVHEGWVSYRAGEELSEPDLKFTGSSEFDWGDFQTALTDVYKSAESKVDAEIAEQVASHKDDQKTLNKQLEEIQAKGKEFNDAVADAKAKLEKAEKDLQSAIDAYNGAIERPLEKLNAIADANGLNQLSSNQNPIRSYRSIDFKKRVRVPDTCPDQRRSVPVDMLKEDKVCGYIQIPSGFEAHTAEIVAATKEALLEIPKLEERLGKKASWLGSGTGAYGNRDMAQNAYDLEARDARREFGDNSQRERQELWLTSKLEVVEAALAETQTPEYREELLDRANVYHSDESSSLVASHTSPAYKAYESHIVKGPQIVMGETDAVFSDLEGGYEGAIIVAEFIGEHRGQREPIPTINYIDLTDERIADADELRAEVSRESIRQAARVEIRNERTITEAINNRLENLVEARLANS